MWSLSARNWIYWNYGNHQQIITITTIWIWGPSALCAHNTTAHTMTVVADWFFLFVANISVSYFSRWVDSDIYTHTQTHMHKYERYMLNDIVRKSKKSTKKTNRREPHYEHIRRQKIISTKLMSTKELPVFIHNKCLMLDECQRFSRVTPIRNAMEIVGEHKRSANECSYGKEWANDNSVWVESRLIQFRAIASFRFRSFTWSARHFNNSINWSIRTHTHARARGSHHNTIRQIAQKTLFPQFIYGMLAKLHLRISHTCVCVCRRRLSRYPRKSRRIDIEKAANHSRQTWCTSIRSICFINALRFPFM